MSTPSSWTRRAAPSRGALSLADVNLMGSARTPRPSIVVALHSYPLDPQDPLGTQVDVSDTTLQTGQGMHGSFGPGDVANTMIAFGPDYKQGFVDAAPAGNAGHRADDGARVGFAAGARAATQPAAS